MQNNNIYIYNNYPLRNYNTFGLSVLARYFVRIENTLQLKDLINGAFSTSLKNQTLLILGGGSNVLFVNDEYKGLVMFNQIKGIYVVREDTKYVWVKAYSGEVWDDVVKYCVEKNWGGIENLSLIPGFVGAAPIQNIGAYGVEIKDVLESLEAIRLSDGQLIHFDNKDCRFTYRNSIFKQELKNQVFITSITLKLLKQPELNIKYGVVKDRLEKRREEGLQQTGIREVSRVIRQIRQEKLPDPKVLGNSGSFFKNPEINKTVFEKLQQSYPDMPHYRLPNNQYKIPAAWLIEQCGWKGKCLGDAGVYQHHALVIVNHGQASGKEIYELSRSIQQSVWDTFNIRLETEVNIVV